MKKNCEKKIFFIIFENFGLKFFPPFGKLVEAEIYFIYDQG